MSAPRTVRRLTRRVADRRSSARADRRWRSALTRSATPSARAELELMHEVLR